jgi:hypothetical protein
VLTFFTTAKPFRERSGVIQRNALKSWTLLHPDVEVILFGDEEGAAEVAQELKIRHEARVERFGGKLPYVNSLFLCAEQLARNDILCYANCDIVLLPDFCPAVARVREVHSSFLMVGRRWDTDITNPIDFSDIDWPQHVRQLALAANGQMNGSWIDYFAFSRGLFGLEFPPLVIGRPPWDNWTVWKALQKGPVVDASGAVLAVHQNHDYGSHPAGRFGVWTDEPSRHNLVVAGSRWHLCTIDDATHLLSLAGLRPNPERRKQQVRRFIRALKEYLWFGALDWSRPIRKTIGLRKKNRDALFARLRRLVSR